MTTIKQLKEKRTEVVNRAKARIEKAESEGRTLNDEELKGHVADEKEIKDFGDRIARQEALQEWETDHSPTANDPPNPVMQPPRQNPDQKNDIRVTPMRYRFRPLRNFPNTPAGEEQAYRAGQWVLAVVFGNKKAENWCKEHGIKIEMAASEGTDTAGGYLVVPEFERAIVDVRDMFGTFGRLAKFKPMASSTMSQPKRTAGVTAYWEDEGNAPSESSQTWTQIGMAAKRLSAYTLISRELEQDAIINVADDAAQEIGYAMAYKEDLAGWLGDGTSTYGGFTGTITKINDGNYTNSIVTAATANTAFSTLDLDDFEAMVGKLPDYAAPGAAWYISRPGWAASMMRLQYAAGGNSKSDVASGVQYEFLGYPVNFIPVMNTTLTAQVSATGVVLFGDLTQAAYVGRRRELEIQVLRELYALNNQIAVVGHERVGFVTHTLSTPSPNVTGAGPLISLSLPGS